MEEVFFFVYLECQISGWIYFVPSGCGELYRTSSAKLKNLWAFGFWWGGGVEQTWGIKAVSQDAVT